MKNQCSAPTSTHTALNPVSSHRTQLNARYARLRCLLPALLLLLSAALAGAASGTWTNDASGLWSASTNWLGTISDGIDASADFSTINITANRAVTLDSSRTNGNLLFGDTNGAQVWVVNASGGSVLTLATSAGTPTITTYTNGANNYVAAITAPLAGTNGFTKAGDGVLALGGTNTYTGATTISGGTLLITNGPGGLMNGSGGLVAYYSFNKVSGTRVINEGSGGNLMDGYLVGSGGVSIGAGIGRFGDNCLNVTQGAVNNNANGANMGIGGYMLVNSPVVPFTATSGSALANWTWALWLKTTTQGAAYMYQGSAGWVSGNTAWYLTTGASVVGGGVRAAGVRNSQGWEEGTAVINDGNWHHIAMTCSAGTKVMYVDGSVDAFLVNGWNGNGVGSQLWIGGTGGTLGDGNVSMVGLIDKVAIYNRALTLAEIQSLTNNVVPGLAAPAIPLSSPVSVAAGAKLDMNGCYATLTNLTGLGTVDSSVAGGVLNINDDSDITFGGILTNSAASSSGLWIYKTGTGTLNITNTSTYNGQMTIRGGTVNLTGSIITNTTTANNQGVVVVADTTNKAVLKIASGATLWARNLVVGGAGQNPSDGAGAAGAVYNFGSFKNLGNTGTGAFAIGNATGGAATGNNSYGYFLHDTPNPTSLGESGVGGLGGGDGVFEMKSGTANFTNWITLGRSQGTVAGSSQRSLMLIRNGTVNGPSRSVNTDGIRPNWSGSVINEISVFDIGAGGKLGSLGTGANINLNQANNGNAVSMLTVSGGGIVQVYNIYSFNAAPLSIVNLNNGTLQPMGTFAQFLGTGLDDVFVYSGGVTFDSQGFDIGVVPQLLAPTGSSITSIPVTSIGSGYIGRPIVQITDGSGVGATAVAEWDLNAGTVTNITITSPGSGYSSPTVTLVGGGYTTAATLGTPVLSAASSGGLTKVGLGTLTLSGGSTYTGPTLVLGGGLSVISGVTPAGGDLTVSNATLSLDDSSGSSFPAGNLAFLTNVTLNVAYGTVLANPANPAINATGTLLATATNITINISAFGLKTGVFPLINYTGPTPGSIANFTLGTLPPGVTANLVNNPNSLELNITGTGQNLSWYGLLPDGVTVSSNWDITLTTNWVAVGTTSPALRYQEYTSAGSTVGDPVTFDDTLYNDFVNPQPTNINLTTTIRPFRVTANNSAVPYSILGAGGITGLGSLVKSNTGALILATSNSFSGGASIYGGSVVLSNASGLGASAGALVLGDATLQVSSNVTKSGAVSFVGSTGSTIDVIPGVTVQFSGPVSGAGVLTKTDSGTLTFSGTNGMTGALNINQGTVTTTGSNNVPGVVTVGSAGNSGVLRISGGIFQANNTAGQFNSGLIAGPTAGSAGDIVLSSGTLYCNYQLGLGAGAGGFGGLTMNGGTLFSGSYIVVGFAGDTAVFNQTAGNCTVATNLMTIAAGSSTSVGVATFSGSSSYTATNSVTGNNTGRGGMFVGENGTGTLNVSGTATVLASGQANVTLGRQSGSAGTVNLLGGTLTTPQVLRGAGSGILNFNGGTLKASAASATFLAGLNSANVYSGGATIDDGGFAITVPQPFAAPAGFGVSSIPLSAGGSGYIDTPVVTISGGSGSNATAIASVSGGAVTGFVVTSPGIGYLSGEVLSVALSGGGGTGAAAGTPVLTANVGGGLTKKGAGTLTLGGSNVFNGPVTVAGGTLNLSGGSTYSGGAAVNGGVLSVPSSAQLSGNVTVTNGAGLALSQIGSGSFSIGGLTLGVTGTNPANLSLAYANGNTASPLLTCTTLTLNGTNNINIAGRFTVGTLALVKYTTIAGTGAINTNIGASQGVVAYLSNSVANSTLYAVITSTGPGLIWTGNNSNPALTNLWDIGSTTNWLINATATTYQETVPPGDLVTFNDVGSGTVILNTNVHPFSVVLSNNATDYTLSGSGTIGGSATLQKLGTGTVTINLTNDSYQGDTALSNGLVRAGAAGAISANANLDLGPSGKLDLGGFSQTVKGLFGSGLITDSSANSPTLTVGNGGASADWSGTISNDTSSSSGMSLTKIGNGTLILRGANYLNSVNASQVNSGLTIITNGGLVSCASSELWIAQNANTATAIVDGGTLVTSNNWLVVGRNATAATGTLIVNHGLVQKAGANNIVLGSLGANGTLIVNGGQVLNNAMLWLGENSTAQATLRLNGGLLQASQIRGNDNGGGLPTTGNSVAYFNGGTLQATANSDAFFGSPTFLFIQSGGLVLDDGGFTIISPTQLLQEDPASTGGGLVKKGSGSVYIDTANSYTGPTIVTNGTLGGSGTFASPMSVGPAGNINPGAAGTNVGTLTLSTQPLTLQGRATFRISKVGGVAASDLITGISTATLGGTLVLSNVTWDGNVLAVGDGFTLFNAAAYNGVFSSIVPASPGSGLAWNTNQLAITGVLAITNGPANPTVSSVSPATPTGSSYPQALGIVGSGFQSGCTVLVSNVDTAGFATLPATFTDSAHISVSPVFGTAPHNWAATVINPGGATSTPFAFSVVAPPRPGISSIKVAGGQVILSGVNGTAGLDYAVLSSTNVAAAVATWTPVVTNVFGAGGAFSWTNSIDPSLPRLFYIIKP